jgi:hypothetical protein
MARTLIAVLWLLVAGAVPQLAAQEENKHQREGFWFALSTGPGSVGYSCDGCADLDREFGFAGHIRAGAAVHPMVLLGVESDGWWNWGDEAGLGSVTRLLWGLTGNVYVYPSATGGFWLQAGAGLSSYRESADIGTATSSGVGIIFGAGYDIRLAQNFSLAPYASVLFSVSGNAKFEGVDTGESFNTNLVQVGLSAVFH